MEVRNLILGVLAAVATWQGITKHDPEIPFEIHLWATVACYLVVRNGLRGALARGDDHRRRLDRHRAGLRRDGGRLLSAVRPWVSRREYRGGRGARPLVAREGATGSPLEHDPEKHALANAGVDTGFRKRLVPAKAGIVLHQ